MIQLLMVHLEERLSDPEIWELSVVPHLFIFNAKRCVWVENIWHGRVDVEPLWTLRVRNAGGAGQIAARRDFGSEPAEPQLNPAGRWGLKVKHN